MEQGEYWGHREKLERKHNMAAENQFQIRGVSGTKIGPVFGRT